MRFFLSIQFRNKPNVKIIQRCFSISVISGFISYNPPTQGVKMYLLLYLHSPYILFYSLYNSYSIKYLLTITYFSFARVWEQVRNVDIGMRTNKQSNPRQTIKNLLYFWLDVRQRSYLIIVSLEVVIMGTGQHVITADSGPLSLMVP